MVLNSDMIYAPISLGVSPYFNAAKTC